MPAPLRLYDQVLLHHPRSALLLILIVTLLLGWQARHFQLDASAESLLLEEDRELAQFREASRRYAIQEFLVVTFTPNQPLLQSAPLATLERLRDELEALPGVASVTSILDVPLLTIPPVPLHQVKNNVKTLQTPGIDLGEAKQELSQHPIYDRLLINTQANTTALQANLPIDHRYRELLAERRTLREQGADQAQINRVTQRIQAHNAEQADKRHQLISEVRALLERYRDEADLHLGGVPMIADDMIRFVKKDLLYFGSAVLALVILILAAIFRQWRWVGLPLLCCFTVTVLMVGLLGWARWEVTVVSSNFIALLLIVTLSLSIHVAVRYRECRRRIPGATQHQLVRETVRRIFIPCLYTALTTMVGFASLVFSGIRPVINFGWMMTSGILVALLITFILLPTLLILLGRGPAPRGAPQGPWLTRGFARLNRRLGASILVLALLLAGASLWGMTRLEVENSFINYFSRSTEIYQGMRWIDRHLGGTAPLSVLIDFPAVELDTADEEDPFWSGGQSQGDSAQYWFTPHKIARIKAAHRYLEDLPETGKVLSLASLMAVIEPLNDNRPLSYLELVALYQALPEAQRERLLTPFVSVADNQVRISVRIIDSDPRLRRAELLAKIRRDLTGPLGFEPERVHITGMMVLYNNVLQSLFDSLIMSMGAVFVGILVMFLLLFRALSLALIALFPNLLAAAIVLAVMGWLKIPLDIMTITIAAISIGIAVDQAIHYIYRFRLEFARDGDYRQAMRHSHESIGQAILYTSLTIILGFSILGLSNFIPTIYFGLLTGLAMLIALIAALTLLPQLLIFFKPLGAESPAPGSGAGEPVVSERRTD